MSARLNFYKASPNAIKAMLELEEHIATSGLEKPLVELIRLRASQINGCAFCVDMHATDARKAGESERRLAFLCVWREAPLFSERERAALAWTESLTLIAENHVPDNIWDEAKAQFTEAELVDMTLLITAINGWNRFAIAFRKLPTK